MYWQIYKKLRNWLNLYDHTDDAARNKFIGVELDYKESYGRLEAFNGNPLKVVQSCKKEVLSVSFIPIGDYKGLVEY